MASRDPRERVLVLDAVLRLRQRARRADDAAAVAEDAELWRPLQLIDETHTRSERARNQVRELSPPAGASAGRGNVLRGNGPPVTYWCSVVGCGAAGVILDPQDRAEIEVFRRICEGI